MRVQRSQLVGGPDWIETARFDIVAKAEGDIPRGAAGGPPGPLNFMMQDLLEDRFKLRAHRETRELPIYALMLARTRRKLGPGLRASTIDCAQHARLAERAWARTAARYRRLRRTAALRHANRARVKLTAGGVPLAQLTQMLSQFTQRIVVDRTGLTGNFDIDLTLTPDACRRARLRLVRHRYRRSIRTVHRCSPPCRSSSALSLSLNARPSRCSSSIMLNGRRRIRFCAALLVVALVLVAIASVRGGRSAWTRDLQWPSGARRHDHRDAERQENRRRLRCRWTLSPDRTRRWSLRHSCRDARLRARSRAISSPTRRAAASLELALLPFEEIRSIAVVAATAPVARQRTRCT